MLHMLLPMAKWIVDITTERLVLSILNIDYYSDDYIFRISVNLSREP